MYVDHFWETSSIIQEHAFFSQPSSPMSNLPEGDEEEARLEEEQETKLAEMEAEMEKEKEARKLAGASEEEIQKALQLLQRQHDAKRKVKLSDTG